MKVDIKTEMAQMTLEMEPVKAFELIQTAIKYAAEAPQTEPRPLNAPPAPVEPVRQTIGGCTSSNQHLVKGFLFTECEVCGRSWGWNARLQTGHAECRCGHKTPLRNLKQVHFECTCGKRFNYRTNKTQESFEMDCLNCGKIGFVVLNEAKTAYVPMGKIKW